MFSRIARSNLTHVRTSFAKRGMAGHSKYVPQSKFDALARKYFPEDYQISIAICSFYFSLFLGYKLFSSKKVPASVSSEISTPSSSSSIPSIESNEFGDWLSGEGNLEKYIANLE